MSIVEDSIVYLQCLGAVFQRLKENGLKLKPSKCSSLQKQVRCLGHIVLKNGIQTDPEKISAVVIWPVPVNVVKGVQSVFRFVRFYRRFI